MNHLVCDTFAYMYHICIYVIIKYEYHLFLTAAMTDPESTSEMGDPSEWVPHCLLIEDGHLDAVMVGALYTRVIAGQIETRAPLSNKKGPFRKVWHISVPGFNLLSPLKPACVARLNVLKLIHQFATEHSPSHPVGLQIYIVVGSHDFAVPSCNFVNLTSFLRVLLQFIDCLHARLPGASITWLGPCAWHDGLKESDMLRCMHLAIPLLNGVRPYFQAEDFTLGMSSIQAGPYLEEWSEHFLGIQVERLSLYFARNDEIVSSPLLRREVQQLLHDLCHIPIGASASSAADSTVHERDPEQGLPDREFHPAENPRASYRAQRQQIDTSEVNIRPRILTRIWRWFRGSMTR